MNSHTTRLPLAIALSSALALAVGCTADRDNANVDDQTGMSPTDQAAAQTTPPPVAPATAGDPAYPDTAQDRATADTATGSPMDDGRRSDQPVDDTWITTKVKSSLLADSDVSGLAIDVETVNGVVTLSGQVEQQAQIDAATRIARGIEGVTDVNTTGLATGAAADR